MEDIWKGRDSFWAERVSFVPVRCKYEGEQRPDQEKYVAAFIQFRVRQQKWTETDDDMYGLAAVAAAGGGSHVSVSSGRSTVGLVTNDWGNEAAARNCSRGFYLHLLLAPRPPHDNPRQSGCRDTDQ